MQDVGYFVNAYFYSQGVGFYETEQKCEFLKLYI